MDPLIPKSAVQDEYEQRFADLAVRVEQISLNLSPAAAVTLVAQLQLALRHPRNNKASGAMARKICDALITLFESQDARFAELLRMGYDHRFEVVGGVYVPRQDSFPH